MISPAEKPKIESLFFKFGFSFWDLNSVRNRIPFRDENDLVFERIFVPIAHHLLLLWRPNLA
jgi:hypothetical protein